MAEARRPISRDAGAGDQAAHGVTDEMHAVDARGEGLDFRREALGEFDDRRLSRGIAEVESLEPGRLQASIQRRHRSRTPRQSMEQHHAIARSRLHAPQRQPAASRAALSLAKSSPA
jgi:hypothetical protein